MLGSHISGNSEGSLFSSMLNLSTLSQQLRLLFCCLPQTLHSSPMLILWLKCVPDLTSVLPGCLLYDLSWCVLGSP